MWNEPASGRPRSGPVRPARDAGGAGRADVDEAVAALGERLHDRRDAGHADLQAGVERDLDLGDRGQPAVDVRVGADDLDLEAGDAALADLVERVRDAVHRPDAVGDQGDAHRLVAARGEPPLLAPEERGGRRVGDRGHAGVEQREPDVAEVVDAGAGRGLDDGGRAARASLRSWRAGRAGAGRRARSRRPGGRRSGRRRRAPGRPRRARRAAARGRRRDRGPRRRPRRRRRARRRRP